jgi:hypothetical protein
VIDTSIEHQDEVVERTAAVVATQLGGRLTAPMHWPEKKRPAVDGAVDGIATTSLGSIAIEHTYLESFTGELEDNLRVSDLLGGLVTRLSGSLPRPGHYTLDVAVGAVAGHQGDDLAALEVWARAHAGELGLGSLPRQPAHQVRGGPPELPFEVTFSRFDRDSDQQLRVTRPTSAERLEHDRTIRITEALARKLPKLDAARSDPGFTALVFETSDIQLVNMVSTTMIVRAALQRTPALHAPDFIILVRTSMLEAWYVEWIKFRDRWSPNSPRSHALAT